ncbi:hypothetical protein BH11MYX1_BH11MYX1_52300 [soil metagenome]
MRTWLVLGMMYGIYGVAHAAPDASLSTTDWCNWTYANTRIYPRLIDCKATVDERHSEHGGIWAFEEFRFVSATYGDLTGDGGEDALLALEVTLRPVLIAAGKPSTTAKFWLMQRRPDGTYIYTSESSDRMPTSVTIAKGVATLQWRDRGKLCEERWRFKREGEGAEKTPRACTP